MINTILVPQGSEYQAVCRGLSRIRDCQTQVIAIPMGIKPLQQFLEQNCQYLNQNNQQILLIGLCGSLNQRYGIGDIVLYQDCIYQGNVQNCNSQFTAYIHNQFGDQVSFVKGLTSDRVISLATEKHQLYQKFAADVVDMEGFPFLQFFSPEVSVAILRVISDECLYDIPNLTTAISADGSLQPLSLAGQFIRQPLAAIRLIHGSLQGLKVLETTAYRLGISQTSK